MILIIDNYDSFTYNIAQLFESRGSKIKVALNDQISIEEIRKLGPNAIVISPGPCTPKEAGICTDIVKEFYNSIPIFGICLGHQVIGEAFGSTIVRGNNIVHGKTDTIIHNNKSIFSRAKPLFTATRYHSLIIDRDSLKDDLEVIAISKSDGSIMAVRHKQYPVFGVQFHPESYASECADEIIDYFLNISKEVSHDYSKTS